MYILCIEYNRLYTRIYSIYRVYIELPFTHLSILLNAIEYLLCHQLLEMRYRRLRTAADEASLQILKIIANALEAHVDLLVQTMEIGFGMRLHNLLVVLLVILRYILGAWHVAALVEVTFTARFICKWQTTSYSIYRNHLNIGYSSGDSPSCSFGTNLYTMSCMVRSKLMYCSGCD